MNHLPKLRGDGIVRARQNIGAHHSMRPSGLSLPFTFTFTSTFTDTRLIHNNPPNLPPLPSSLSGCQSRCSGGTRHRCAQCPRWLGREGEGADEVAGGVFAIGNGFQSCSFAARFVGRDEDTPRTAGAWGWLLRSATKEDGRCIGVVPIHWSQSAELGKTRACASRRRACDADRLTKSSARRRNNVRLPNFLCGRVRMGISMGARAWRAARLGLRRAGGAIAGAADGDEWARREARAEHRLR